MSTMTDKDYYAILGVSKDATKKEIQKAFQQKARKLHPDVNKAPDAEERFKEVSEAYAVLSDEEKRARYDAMRSGDPFAQNHTAPYGGGYSGGYAADPFSGFPFGGGWASPRRGAAFNPEAGADVVVDVELSTDSAKHGVKRAIKYRRYEPCSACGGSGSVSSEHSHVCPSCHGSGHIDVDLSFLFGAGVFQTVCPECGGSGKIVGDPCGVCAGTGRTPVMSEAVIEFPADSHDGDVVKISGMGHAGTNGASTGDLIARAHVPAERLEGKARIGFQLIGLVLPFLVLAAFSQVFSMFFVTCLVPLVLGIGLVLSDDVLHRNKIWWKRGFLVIANGFANGLLFALVAVSFASCSQRAVMAPYVR